MAQYMLILHQVPDYNTDLPREKMLEMTKRYMTWADGLRAQGKIAGGERLAAGGVRLVRFKDGKPVVSDGPYAELKDVVGGYFVIEANDQAEAEAIAKDCPHAALAATHWIELRPIVSMAEMRAAMAAAAG
jgi:hypothetical protein